MEIKCPVCKKYFVADIFVDGDVCWCTVCGSELQANYKLTVWIIEEKHNHLKEND